MRVLLLIAATLSAALCAEDTTSRFAPFGAGLTVHYESYGTGREAVVFIHGWTCDLTFWRKQEPLYASRRSLLVDLPGHGQSSKPVVGYPTDLMARGVEAAMRDAGVDRAVLVGHSLGGPVAYALLRQFPEKVIGLVLVDASVVPPSPPEAGSTTVRRRRAARAQALDGMRDRQLRGPNGEQILLHEIEGMFSERTTPEMREEIRTKMLATPPHVRAKALTSPSGLRPARVGQTYDIPAIAVQAADERTGQRFDQMLRLFPRMMLEAWDGYGHFLMMEDPERFNQVLERFLASVFPSP